MATRTITVDDLRHRVAVRLAEYRVRRGSGDVGVLTFEMRPGVVRTFRAHWTGFRLVFTGETLLLRADVSGGAFWSEGYVSTRQPSWVLAFRKKPATARGTGGPRPDDKLAGEQTVETALAHRRRLIEAGVIADEELIRMEDFDDPLEAIDEFFNYTQWYVLKSVGARWEQVGYEPHDSMGWEKGEEQLAALPVEAAVQEALKKSDIVWVTPNTSRRPIPCWFLARDGLIYVLSGERQQVIPQAERVREAEVVCRWKGRDAQLVQFTASVRAVTGADREEFEELAGLLLAKRQSVRGSAEENIERWMRECVILELTPRL